MRILTAATRWLVFLLAAASSSLLAQTTIKSTIVGTVSDAQKAVVRDFCNPQ